MTKVKLLSQLWELSEQMTGLGRRRVRLLQHVSRSMGQQALTWQGLLETRPHVPSLNKGWPDDPPQSVSCRRIRVYAHAAEIRPETGPNRLLLAHCPSRYTVGLALIRVVGRVAKAAAR